MTQQNSITPTVRIKSITFADGTKVNVTPSSILAICGPNNAGKSASLKNILTCLETGQSQVVVRAVEIEKVGSLESIRDLVRDTSPITTTQSGHLSYKGFGYQMLSMTVDQSWQSPTLQALTKFFAIFLKTEDRITDSNPASAISLLTEPPSHPIHVAQRDSRVEERINRVFRKAFDQDFAIHYGGGSQVPIYIGAKPDLEEGEHLQKHSFISRLESSMSPLDTQGDGIRSFSTIALRVLASENHKIILIDEPEAFLHPPQARLLARFLGDELPEITQIIIATHSAAVIQGLLDQQSHNVSIVRVSRIGNTNKTRVLNSDELRDAWADPLIKTSSVLDGIFHRHVCICESDSDCVFYKQILEGNDPEGFARVDVLFTHANGKHGAIKAAKALKALDVPVSIILDIDVLNDEQTFRNAYESMGGVWPDVASDWKSLKKCIDALRPSIDRKSLLSSISQRLSQSEQEGVDGADIRYIRSLLKDSTSWSLLKSGGRQMIPAGTPIMHFNRIDERCRALNFWIVPVGELESFYKSEHGGHGPAWLRKVLESVDFANSPELENARTFMKSVQAGFTAI